MRVASNPTLHGWGHSRRRWVECNGSDLKGVERVVSAQYKSSSKNSGIFRRLVTRGEWSLAQYEVESHLGTPALHRFRRRNLHETPSSFSLDSKVAGRISVCLLPAVQSRTPAFVWRRGFWMSQSQPENSPRTPARLSACAGVQCIHPPTYRRDSESGFPRMIKTAAAGSCGGVVFI